MKKFILFAGSALFSLTIQSQRLDIGANLMLGLPMGNYNFGDELDQTGIPPGLGLGGGVEANYWFSEAFSAGLEVGIVSFGENEINDEGITIKTKGQNIPIIVKGEYHFLEDAIRPFIGLGIGYGIVSREFNVPDLFDAKVSWNQNGLIVSPRAGMLFQVSEIIALNLNVQYNIMTNPVDGDLETTVEMFGDSMTDTNTDMKVDATNYLGINVGVLFTLFD